jgi:hypothetical protein
MEWDPLTLASLPLSGCHVGPRAVGPAWRWIKGRKGTSEDLLPLHIHIPTWAQPSRSYYVFIHIQEGWFQSSLNSPSPSCPSLHRGRLMGPCPPPPARACRRSFRHREHGGLGSALASPSGLLSLVVPPFPAYPWRPCRCQPSARPLVVVAPPLAAGPVFAASAPPPALWLRQLFAANSGPQLWSSRCLLRVVYLRRRIVRVVVCRCWGIGQKPFTLETSDLLNS